MKELGFEYETLKELFRLGTQGNITKESCCKKFIGVDWRRVSWFIQLKLVMDGKGWNGWLVKAGSSWKNGSS